MTQILNRDLLSDNECFGCGHLNPSGLQIDIVRDPDDGTRLKARFQPSERMIGFPGITHGGAIYTALDCLSTWVATLLGPNPEAAWILRSAQTVYRNPAPAGGALDLVGWVEERKGEWDPLTVKTEARRADGKLCVEAEFKVVPLSPEKIASIAGIPEIPENWRAFLSRAR